MSQIHPVPLPPYHMLEVTQRLAEKEKPNSVASLNINIKLISYKFTYNVCLAIILKQLGLQCFCHKRSGEKFCYILFSFKSMSFIDHQQ